MARKPIFDKAMTPAERQRRHREKKQAEQASPDQLMEGFDLAELVKFDLSDFEPFDLAELVSIDPEDLES